MNNILKNINSFATGNTEVWWLKILIKNSMSVVLKKLIFSYAYASELLENICCWQNNVNHKQIAVWTLSWKSFVPKELKRKCTIPSIKTYLYLRYINIQFHDKKLFLRRCPAFMMFWSTGPTWENIVDSKLLEESIVVYGWGRKSHQKSLIKGLISTLS